MHPVKYFYILLQLTRSNASLNSDQFKLLVLNYYWLTPLGQPTKNMTNECKYQNDEVKKIFKLLKNIVSILYRDLWNCTTGGYLNCTMQIFLIGWLRLENSIIIPWPNFIIQKHIINLHIFIWITIDISKFAGSWTRGRWW